MCTLTYIPHSNKDFVFTTNRDEDPRRIAIPPDHYIQNNILGLYPKDEAGSGTWMYCSNELSVCLLNGAFVKHKHDPPYRMSRGVVVLEFAKFRNTIDFTLQYDLSNIEPFTMVVIRHSDDITMEEIRWDGSSIHYKSLDPNLLHIWSSSTLYDVKAKEMRQRWFKEWIKKNKYTPVDILEFHKDAGKGDDYNGLIMNRKDLVRTTSITQIIKENSILKMRYEDLKKEKVTEKYLEKEKSLN